MAQSMVAGALGTFEFRSPIVDRAGVRGLTNSD
jgi:hypothetical protein